MKFKEICEKLKEINASDYQTEAYLILEHIFGVSRADVLINREKEYDKESILSIIEKRKEGIPIQYIFGEWYFMGNKFLVSPDCLIPRPDTEILVEEALKRLNSGGRVADLCTGSGCIGISIAKHRSDINDITLVDISEKALKIAENNARALDVYDKCHFELCDITKKFPNGKYDIIASNPPYIPSEDIEDLSDEVKKEPRLALDGGKDGLDIIKALLKIAPEHLNENGTILIEFGFDQGHKIRKILENSIKDGIFSSYSIIKDYSGNDRVLIVNN